MTREIVPEPWPHKVKRKIVHWWKFLTNAEYRKWARVRWRPELTVVKSTPRQLGDSPELTTVQPMVKNVDTLPIMARINVPKDSEDKKDN